MIVDEDAPWFAYWGPPLTVVDNQPTALANAAVSLLLCRLHHEPEAGEPGAARAGAPGQQAHRPVILPPVPPRWRPPGSVPPRRRPGRLDRQA